MTECLNSDDEDEENHRVLFFSFEYPHKKSCADAEIQGDGQERSPITLLSCFISPAYDTKCRIISPVFRYWKFGGLIT